MPSKDNAYEAVERLARTAQGSYETVIDNAVTLQERNMEFARGVFEATAREYRERAEANRTMARELVARAEEQRDAFRAVVEESFDAYRNVLRVPLSYYEEGLRRAAPGGDANDGFPIPNYEDLTVDEVTDKLESLSPKDVEKVRAYENRHKNRETLLARIDRKAKAAS
jgi:hypothetical protein